MTDTAIQVNCVWKKFRRGEFHDSLRDLIPAVTKRLIGRGAKSSELAHREFWALRDISFEVPRGESLGIIGPNGAGKSTMLKLLSRILKPSRGNYTINGRLSALIEIGAGFHQDLTGRENIYLNGAILGIKREAIRKKEEQIIEFAGVNRFIDTPIKRYSAGMKARLGFAVAAHMDPDILLVDEVLSVGDAKFRHKCLQHMEKLIQSDVTVVFISHLLDQVNRLCPNTIVLDHGKMIYQGKTNGAIKTYIEALREDHNKSISGSPAVAEIKNLRLCDATGREVAELDCGEPADIEFDLILRDAFEDISIQLNIATASGLYLGTASTAHSMKIPPHTGTYRLCYRFDPMPLAEGDYTFGLNVTDIGHNHPLWESSTPRMVTVRGNSPGNAVLRLGNNWTTQPIDNAPPVSINDTKHND